MKRGVRLLKCCFSKRGVKEVVHELHSVLCISLDDRVRMTFFFPNSYAKRMMVAFIFQVSEGIATKA